MSVSTARHPATERSLDWLLASFMISLGAAGLMFVHDNALWSHLMESSTDGVTVGQVVEGTGAIRYRPDGTLLWHDLIQPRRDVTRGDTLFTGDDGRAMLEILGLGSVEVLPRSLVVVEAEPFEKGASRSMVQVQQGGVEIKVEPSQIATIRIKDRSFEVESLSGAEVATVSVHAEDAAQVRFVPTSSSGIRVTETGLGRDQTHKKSVQVEAGVSARSLDAGLEFVSTRLTVQAVGPRGTLVLLPTKSGSQLPVEFSWKFLDEKASQKPLPLEIRGTQGQESLSVSGSSQSVPLAPGEYRWRIGGEQSGWETLILIALRPPELWGPSDGTRVSLETPDSAARKITLSWAPINPKLQAQVQYRDTKTGETKVAFGTLTGAQVELPASQYQWRARALGNEQTSEWSAWRSLEISQPRSDEIVVSSPTIVPIATQVKPEIETLPVLEAQRASASTRLGAQLNLDEIPVALRWMPVPHVTKYRVQIYHQDGKLFQQSEVDQPELIFKLSSLKNTLYSYRIEATLPSGKVIRSGLTKLQIQLSSPVPKLPRENSLQAVGKSLIMTWERTSLTQNYHIQIATTPDFKAPILDKILEMNSQIFTAKSPGIFYWRVKGLTHGHQSEWSKPARFRVR